MNPINPRHPLLERFVSFVNSLTATDNIAILHHTDPDGISSAVILNKLVENVRGKVIDLRLNQQAHEVTITPATYDTLVQKKITKIIITDLAVDQQDTHFIKNLEAQAQILIIDHHEVYQNLNSGKTIHLKPQMLGALVPAHAYCASKFTYDLSQIVTDVSLHDWVAVLGIIGDNAVESWQSFVQTVFDKYHFSIGKNISESQLGHVTSLLFYAQIYDTSKVAQCYDILNSAAHAGDVICPQLLACKQQVESDIQKWRYMIHTLSAQNPSPLMFAAIAPAYSIKSALISEISELFPHKTIVIAEDMHTDFVTLSARRLDGRVAVNMLLEKNLSYFPHASGGGHIHSAGGRIRRQDVRAFQNLVTWQLTGAAAPVQYGFSGNLPT